MVSVLLELETNVDDQPVLWQLYLPEEQQYKDPNLYLWVRRCSLFTSVDAILKSLIRIGIRPIQLYNHSDFPELGVVIDDRNRRFYICRAPINDENGLITLKGRKTTDDQTET